MKKILLALFASASVASAQTVSLYNTFVFHNTGTLAIQGGWSIHDSYTGFNIGVNWPGPSFTLPAGSTISIVTFGSAYPVYQGDVMSYICGCADWSSGNPVTTVLIGGGSTYTLGPTSIGSPTTVDVYLFGGDGGGSGPAVSTNSLFCVTINNTSGTGNSYGIANIDTGVVLSQDECGDNETYVPAGGTAQICVTAAASNNLALVTETGGGMGSQSTSLTGANPGRSACGTLSAYDPNFTGTIASTNLVGTPIPPGAGAGSVVNNNGATSPFGTSGTTYTAGTNGNIAGIAGTAGSPLLLESTGVIGFDAVFAELVNVANSVGKLDVDNNNGLGAIKGVAGSIVSGQGSGNALLTTDTADLASINAGISSQGGALTGISSDTGHMAIDLAAATNQLGAQVVDLNGISNLLYAADGTLYGMSNGVFQIATNTAGLAASLGSVSNYASSALAGTNNATGGLSANWSDGVNIASLTNHASAFAFTPLNELTGGGTTAQGASTSRGIGSLGTLDSSFWTLNMVMGDTTYSFDLNPMDNAGIAALANLARNWEQWLLCFIFLFLVMRIFDKYVASLGATQQLQANRAEILGNSVGQLAGAVYLPIMVGVMAAIPLFIGTALSGTTIGSAAFGALTLPPWGSGSLTGALGQSLWLADQFIPINFFIATLLWYVFIRLTAAPIWAGAMVLLKTLLS